MRLRGCLAFVIALLFALTLFQMTSSAESSGASGQADDTMISLYDKKLERCAIQMKDTYAVQFKSNAPFDEVDLFGASWNNDIGSLELSVYPWLGSYDETLTGKPSIVQNFHNFPDNSMLKLKMEKPLPEGEYLLYIRNTSEDPLEQVGFWAFNGVTEHIRNYQDEAETPFSASVELHQTEKVDPALGGINRPSENGTDLTVSDGALFPEGESASYVMDDNALMAVQFKADSPFSGCEVYFPATPVGGGNVTFSLYAWDKNYPATVSKPPIKADEVKNIHRNTWAGIDGSFPAGEYLLVLSGGVSRLKTAVIEKPSDNSVTYLHTARCGISLAARLKGDKIKTSVPSDAEPVSMVASSDWAAVDGLGRIVPDASETGKARKDRYVGLFFHTWHSNLAPVRDIVNVSKTVAEHPEAVRDYDHPAWQGKDTCVWNEPIYGYYNTIDRWVLRKQAELLADAGVDVVFFDNTNGTENYIPAVMTLCEVWAEARADGVKTPQISYLLNMYGYDDTAKQLIELYDKIYSKGLYKDLWFMWDGKPLVIAYPEHLLDMGRKDVYDFFTFRTVNPAYTQTNDLILPHGDDPGVKFAPENGFDKYTAWKWISIYPQQEMKNKETGELEEMCACVAQNWSAEKGLTAMNAGDKVFGRGYTNAKGIDTSEYAMTHGLNLQEQMDLVLEKDPKFVFITGWNEWEAGRYKEMWGDKNAIPDNALDGYSRDIEPSTGILKDHFYYQLVSFIRRFKGLDSNLAPQKPVSVPPDKIDWDKTEPVYRSYKGNTLHRDADGYKGYHYNNATGRNDITEARVAYDKDNIYFMVRTAEPLTPSTDPAWMRLLLDTGGKNDGKNDWEGYEYIINRLNPKDGKGTLEKSVGGWNWEKVIDVDEKIDGDRLVITVPRKAIGMDKDGFALSFKWLDNTQKDGDIMDVYVSGDAAPGGRFRYVFKAEGSGEVNASDADEKGGSDSAAN